MSSYILGQTVRLTATFTNPAGQAADPTTVRFKVKEPSSKQTTYTYVLNGLVVVKSATGIYYIDVLLDKSGYWYYRWEGSGANAGALESSVQVDRSQFE